MATKFKVGEIASVLSSYYRGAKNDAERLMVRNIADEIADSFIASFPKFDRANWFQNCGMPRDGHISLLTMRAMVEKTKELSEEAKVTGTPIVMTQQKALTNEDDLWKWEHVSQIPGLTLGERFAIALTRKLGSTRFNGALFTSEKGYKYEKIVMSDSDGTGRSVHCFVDRKTCGVMKAAGWTGPQRNADKTPAVRFYIDTPERFNRVVKLADFTGAYLYDKKPRRRRRRY